MKGAITNHEVDDAHMLRLWDAPRIWENVLDVSTKCTKTKSNSFLCSTPPPRPKEPPARSHLDKHCHSLGNSHTQTNLSIHKYLAYPFLSQQCSPNPYCANREWAEWGRGRQEIGGSMGSQAKGGSWRHDLSFGLDSNLCPQPRVAAPFGPLHATQEKRINSPLSRWSSTRSKTWAR